LSVGPDIPFEKIARVELKDADMNNGNSLADAAISGVRWSAVGQITGQGVRFGVSVSLARLLVPEDFGLLGMAVVITGFMQLFRSLGTTGVIIQKEELSSELLSSLFIINVAMGLILAGSLALSGAFVASLYGTARVAPIMQVLGVTFVISSFGLVQRSLLNRDMRFDRLVPIELITTVVQGVTAISLACLGWKVWALVVANIVNSMVSTCLLYWVSPWRCRLCFRWSEVRNVKSYGLNLTGAHIAGYLLRNTDKLIIGRFLGAASLGYYSMAYSLYMVPLQSITSILNRLLFPVFTRLQADDARLRREVLRAIGGIAFLTFPMLAGLGVVAQPFVVGLLGDKWSPIIRLIMIFCPVGMLNSIAATTGNIYLAKGRSDWLFRWQLGAGITITVSFACGLPWGIVGVASAYAIVMLPLAYLSFVISFRLINLQLVAVILQKSAVFIDIYSSWITQHHRRILVKYRDTSQQKVRSTDVIVADPFKVRSR